jgi:DNA-binding CsgD family transcriptional regulator
MGLEKEKSLRFLCSKFVYYPYGAGMMNHQEFQSSLESLTPRQREVLWLFLDARKDEEIAASLGFGKDNSRQHITNICKKFGYDNDEGESYSYRPELIMDFIQHQPDKVSDCWKDKFLPAQAEEPDFPGRPLAINTPYYLVRPPAEQLAIKVLKPGAVVRIRGPRKTGKTSLLYRTLHQAREKGCQTAAVKLYRAGNDILGDVNRFLQWFCLQIGDEVGLPPKLEDYWSDLRGDASSCSQYLQSYILAQLEQPIIVGIDEADLLFEYPQTAKTFFRLLRGWSEEGKESPQWQQFRQVVVYATEIYLDFDLNNSPFNVGTPIKLSTFKTPQIEELARRYGLAAFTAAQANELFHLVGGHPHLIQLALYHLYNGWSFEQVMATSTSQTGIYGNHLQALMDKLTTHGDLANGFKTVVASPNEAVTLEAKPAKQLEGLGLVKRSDTQVEMSCRLYHQYFVQHF